jgi:hypothetical protein
MAVVVESSSGRVGSGAGRAALLVGCLCLAAACGGRGPVRGDGATDTATGADASKPIDAASAHDAADGAPLPPVDAAPDVSAGGPDARDAAPDAADAAGMHDAVGAADAADAGGVADAGPRDGPADVGMPPTDGPPDTSVGGSDARDGAPDSPQDGPLDVPPDVGDGSVEARSDAVVTPGCPVDCAHLPHVRLGIVTSCSAAGTCVIPPGSCETGWGHCSANPNDGCETDLSKPATCGSCTNACRAPYPSCAALPGGGFYMCGPSCTPPLVTCYYSCVDVQNDQSNCGACGHSCYLPLAVTSCVMGQCTFSGCSDPAYADCTSDPGCETQLGTDTNCAGCGDKVCTLANTLITCQSANSCTSAVCAAGFANCDAASPDCETSFAGGGSCLPGYLGTTPLATQALNDAAVAIGTDGSYYLAGEFSGTVDFDPTTAQDIRMTATPNDVDGFITKINPDGSYAWTRTLGGRGGISVVGLAAAAGGAVVAVGTYSDSVDLDPGSGTDLHQTATPYAQDVFAVRLAGDGSFVWGRSFAAMDSSAYDTAAGVAVDATDAVYVVGNYLGTVDFGSGGSPSVHTVANQSGVLVKLTSAGALSWVQSVEDTGCVASLTAVTVATDGSVWGVGAASTGPYCAFPSPAGAQGANDALIVAYTAAGAARGSWTLEGGYQVVASSVAAGTSGSVYVAGTASGGLVDFDPGPGVAKRWMSSGSDGYILKLGSDAGFAWVQTVPGVPNLSLGATPDGGVLGVGAAYASSAAGLVIKLGADGKAAWTFAFGSGQTNPRMVTSRGADFAVAGISSGSGDFDPGAAFDIVFGDIVFLSRFTF